MDKQEFRRLGHAIVDWIADYMDGGYQGAVAPHPEPGAFMALVPKHPPSEAETGDAVFADFQKDVLPNLVHWNDPRFFAYFPCNGSYPGVLADLLGSGVNINSMNWATSPAATELEIRMVEWLGEMIGLPWPGCLQDTASTATLCAAVAARELKADINRDGFYDGPRLTAYTSVHANTSVLKAFRMAGFGDAYIRRIEAGPDYAMRLEALEAAVEADLAAGYLPTLVVPTLGTTSSAALDPIEGIANLCEKVGMWQHVDAAMVGSAAILPEKRWIMAGVERADSFVFNPHKWLFSNFGCSAHFVKDPLQLKRALSIGADFLKTAQDGSVENFRDWGVQLGRPFRALKPWFVIRSYGVDGLQARLREHIAMASWLADQIREHAQTELVVEPHFNTVCFRLESDAATCALLERLNESGDAYLSPTRLDDKAVIRVSFGQTRSKMSDAEALWQLILSLI